MSTIGCEARVASGWKGDVGLPHQRMAESLAGIAAESSTLAMSRYHIAGLSSLGSSPRWL